MNYKIINVKDHKEYKEKAASFFASKWGIEESEYLKSIEESFTSTTYPMWYLAIENGTKFSIREGGRTVGAGTVSEIIE